MQKYSDRNAILSSCSLLNIAENEQVTPPKHDPVLLHEVVRCLRPAAGESVLDVTLGLGGHAQGLAKHLGVHGVYTGIDADAENLTVALQRLASVDCTVRALQGNFREVIDAMDGQTFDVIFADLGVSSPHFDDPLRGFTFRADAPLDMRYDRNAGLTAASYIVQASEQDLYEVFRVYGEIQRARSIAKALKSELPSSTSQLRAIAERLFGYRAPSVLPQIFQALRIAVNGEILALERLLDRAPTLLSPGGRLGIISYHSLEDRLVKQRFRSLSTPEIDDRTGAIVRVAPFMLVSKKPIVPTAEELERNPRSRSAKFRWIERRISD